MCMTKYTFIDYMTNPIKFSLVICDNRGGFLPLINYDATELFQYSTPHSVIQSVKNAAVSAPAEFRDGTGSV